VKTHVAALVAIAATVVLRWTVLPAGAGC